MADPGKRAFHDPAFRQDDKTTQLVALGDLELPGARLGYRGSRLRSLIGGIGEGAFDERERATGAPIELQFRAVTVLYVGGVDNDIQQEADRVDENMPLAARNLLARIEALRAERRAPF